MPAPSLPAPLAPRRTRPAGPPRAARARRAVAGLVAVAAVALLLAGCAAPTTRLTYAFEGSATPIGTVPDLTGPHDGTVVGNGRPGATVTSVLAGAGGSGRAASFPAPCPNGDARCPRVVVTTPTAAELDPGTEDFAFGARIRVRAAELTPDHGSNVVQKGLSTTSQWKLQVDDAAGGRPSCVLRSTTGAVVGVIATIGVADGAWHLVTCHRAGTALAITVDGSTVGTQTLPAGFDVRPTGRPLTLGGTAAVAENDQYHGDLDDVTYGVVGA